MMLGIIPSSPPPIASAVYGAMLDELKMQFGRSGASVLNTDVQGIMPELQQQPGENC